MKRSFLSLVVLAAVFALTFGSWSWATCPEEPGDLGDCDSIHVEKWRADTLFTGGGPYFARVPMYLTHDVYDTVILSIQGDPPETSYTYDSLAGLQTPLCFTHSNPAKYCSLSSYWNLTTVLTTSTRSIFRHLWVGTDTTYNWMLRQKVLGDEVEENWVWSNILLNLDGTSHFWLLLVPTTQPLFGDESRALMATMTFKMQDTMHVCIDSCFWPPSSHLSFSRPNGETYVPRDNLPYCFWVGPSQIRVTSPDGGESWAVGTPHNITWLSENFSGANVKIDYSTNSGSTWIPVSASTSNTGSYPWVIPNTPSTQCRVRVSDLDDDPYDISNTDFSITAPDFTINATPDTQTVQAGQSKDYNVTLTSLNGFASSCTLTVSGVPAGTSANFSPNPIIPTAASTLTIGTTGATPPGTYDLIITASQLSKTVLQHKDTVVLVVTPGADFTMDVEPDTQEIQAGNFADYAVTLTSLNGFASPCTLTLSGLPPDASGSFDLNPVTPTGTSNLQITTAETTPPDTYTVTVTATEMTGKGIVHNALLYLIVTPVPSFTIGVTPETLLVSQGAQDSFEVTLSSLYGFSSACTLTVSGIPAEASGAFNPPTVVPTGSSTLNITVGVATSLGTYPLTIIATELASGPKNMLLADTVKAFLVVRGPGDFSIAVSPDTLIGTIGHDSSYQVILTSLAGFASSCTLTLAGLPAWYGFTFDPPTLFPTGTSDLIISVPDTARPDTFSLTITATEQGSGKGLEHSEEVTLIVAWERSGMEIDTVIPDTRLIKAGNSTDYQVIVAYFGGFTLPCTLSVSGLPASGASGSFVPNPVDTSSDTSVLTISTDVSCPIGTYELTIRGKCISIPGRFTDSAKVVLIVEEPSAVDDESDQPNAPDKFALFANKPNPFNPETKISYYLPKACQTKLTIYNVLGQKVRTLFDGHQEAGTQSLAWNGRDDDGNQLSSGIYFYRLQADDFAQTRKMSLVK